MKKEDFFKNLTVIELASVLAGPSVGMFFAELGATVIKYENARTQGDMTRHWRLPTEDIQKPISAYYASVNYRKQAIFVDYNDPSDLVLVQEAIQTADIVIANFPAGKAQKWSLDAASCLAANPSIIYANISGYGPDNNRPAFDVLLQAETGYLSMTGYADEPPAKMPVALIDVLAAHQLKEAILIAMINRDRTGEGTALDVSLYDTAISSLTNQATNYLMENHIPKPMGTAHPNIAPYGDSFLTLDGRYLVLAIGTDRQFHSLGDIPAFRTVIHQDKFATNSGRVQHREELVRLLAQIFQTKPARYWMPILEEHRIPSGLVRHLGEVFSEVQAQELVLSEVIEEVPSQRVSSVVFKVTDK